LAQAFFVIGHARFNFDYDSVVAASLNVSALNGTAGIVHRATRLDMTRALSTAAAVVSSPPFIQTTTPAIKIYLIIVSVVCGAFALMCFASILYHRKHPVMTLSQGSFLAALVAACFVQIVFVFTYLPTQNIYCTLAGPLELIPMHVGGSILVARVWRAYSALGMAALIGRQGNNGSPSSSLSPSRPRSSRRTFELLERCHLGKKYIQCLSWLARLPLRCLGRHHSDPMRHTIRKKVTAAETASLAAVLSFPQVFLQVFGAAYYHRGLELQLDSSANIGRYLCQSYGRWVDQAGIGLVGLVYIGAVAAAWIARLLPSVFNEKNQVFHASFVNCLIAFITLPLLELTNDPTDSPDVQVRFLKNNLCLIEQHDRC
jgi:7 transmembrane sweet-taste receptor of 3 GCPR